MTGPLHLVGHSIGGLFAYEATPLLEASGQSVGALVLVDTLTPQVSRLVHPPLRRRVRVALGIPPFWRAAYWRDRNEGDAGIYRFPTDEVRELYGGSDPVPMDRPVQLLVTEPSTLQFGHQLGWDEVHAGELMVRAVPGDHISLLLPSNVDVLARLLDHCLDGFDSTRHHVDR